MISFLSFIFEYPYDIPYTLLISRDLGFKSVWANNTFFSTGYMHAGLVGTIFYSILVGFILNFIDSSSTKIPIFIALGIVIVPWYSLISAGDLTTTLLTHGLGIALLAIYFLNNKTIKNVTINSISIMNVVTFISIKNEESKKSKFAPNNFINRVLNK